MTIQRSIPLLACLICAVFTRIDAAEQSRPLVVAHRGLLRHAPENTLANFRACLELRLGFEFDVERTKDGHLVCIHDSTVDRTTDGTGKLADLTLSQIRKLNAGSWFDPKFVDEKVPTVEEVLKLVAEYKHHDVLIAVDLKTEGAERELVQLAEEHKVLQRLLFIGRTISDPAVRRQLKLSSSNAQCAAVANSAEEFPKALGDSNAEWVYFRYLPPQQQMQAVHDAGKRAFIAGPKVAGHHPQNWQHCGDVKLDAVLTDFPLDLRQILNGNQ